MNHPVPDTIKCVGVRFFANPELEDRAVLETEEMCRRTIVKTIFLLFKCVVAGKSLSLRNQKWRYNQNEE